MKFKILLIVLFLSVFTSFAKAQAGYRIEIKAPDAKGKTIYLAKYWNGASYTIDSTTITNKGQALMVTDSVIRDGQYLLHIKPNVNFDLLLSGEKQIVVKIDTRNPQNSVIEGSLDTHNLWKYSIALQKNEAEKTVLQRQLSDSTISDKERAKLTRKFTDNNADAANLLNTAISNNSDNWFGIYLKGMQTPAVPHIHPKSSDEASENREYMKEHFFDNISLTDRRFWTTSYFTSLVDVYLKDVVEDNPDSTAQAAVRLVAATQNDPYCFEQMLSYLSNTFSKSNKLGAENVWAALAEEYIFDKNVPWISEVQEASLMNEYVKIQHNRIGMTAVDIPLQKIDSTVFSLYDIDAEYIIMYFYNPTCGHCITEVPLLHDQLYAKYKDKGLEILAINTNPDQEMWEDFVSKNKLNGWINCGDPHYKSQYWMYYDVSGTPMVFVLDKDKKIIAKKIDVKTLEELFEYFIPQ